MRALAVYPAKRTGRIVDHREPAITSATGVTMRMLELGGRGTGREICTFRHGTKSASLHASRAGHQAAIRGLRTLAESWPAAVRRLITSRHTIKSATRALLAARTGIQDAVAIA